MSYLEMYDSTKAVSPGEEAIPQSVHEQAYPPVQVPSSTSDIIMLRHVLIGFMIGTRIQAKFVRQNLTNELAQSILDALPEVQAINLARNNLTVFPNRASPHLIALNISHNHIAIPIALSATFMLIELNLCNNKITE
jgi:hypothetical protein